MGWRELSGLELGICLSLCQARHAPHTPTTGSPVTVESLLQHTVAGEG